MMENTIVMLQAEYKGGDEDVRCFDSVSACAVHFAHEARRQYAGKGLNGDDLFDAVVQDVALLFANYDATTDKDPDEVHGGDDNARYSFELKICTDLKMAKVDSRVEDGGAHGHGRNGENA